MHKNDEPSLMGTVLGTLAVGVILYEIFKPEKVSKSVRKLHRKKRLFISFASGDKVYRDYLVDQAKDSRSPFKFIDMSVKKPWKKSIWKNKCRTKIKGCDGMIVLLSGKIWQASGARWEVKCAKEENIPVVGIHIFKGNQKAILPELFNNKIITWNWKNLEKAIRFF